MKTFDKLEKACYPEIIQAKLQIKVKIMTNQNIIEAQQANDEFIKRTQVAYNEAFENLTSLNSLEDVFGNFNQVEYMADLAKNLKEAYVMQILMNEHNEDRKISELVSSILESDKTLNAHQRNIIVYLTA